MSNQKSWEGKKFYRLLVIGISEEKDCQNQKKLICKCDCGNIVNVGRSALASGNNKSCGCLLKEYQTNRKVVYDSDDKRLYHIWRGMNSRCYDSRDRNYGRYGKRGITVCFEWRNSFVSFRDWAKSNGYSPILTLDRIDNDGNYIPSNCRWADLYTQRNNMSSNVRITINGETHTMTEWGRLHNISTSTIWARINKYGWSEYDAVTIPVGGRR